MDAETFELKGQWEKDRGPQQLAYDFWWHLGHDTMITSEWGTPNMVKDGVNPELLLGGKVRPQAARLGSGQRGATCRISTSAPSNRWCSNCGPPRSDEDLRVRRRGRIAQGSLCVDLDVVPRRTAGKNGKWAVRKVIEIPAEPADPARSAATAPGLQGACRRWCTDINLSLDDRFLYVSCWGTGEFIQYDVSDPANPKKTGSVHLGGIVRRAAHPKNPKQPLNGGPQMVEISRDGKRVYFTNSLYSPWDEQFYPDGVKELDGEGRRRPEGRDEARREVLCSSSTVLRAHQVRLEGGDASSDSYCYSDAR